MCNANKTTLLTSLQTFKTPGEHPLLKLLDPGACSTFQNPSWFPLITTFLSPEDSRNVAAITQSKEWTKFLFFVFNSNNFKVDEHLWWSPLICVCQELEPLKILGVLKAH